MFFCITAILYLENIVMIVTGYDSENIKTSFPIGTDWQLAEINYLMLIENEADTMPAVNFSNLVSL